LFFEKINREKKQKTRLKSIGVKKAALYMLFVVVMVFQITQKSKIRCKFAAKLGCDDYF
jgi:hypothetical protein